MSQRLYAIYGASGCGRGVMPLARQQLAAMDDDGRLVFVDDGDCPAELNGHKVISYADFLSQPDGYKFMCIAIANSVLREKIAAQLSADNIEFWSVAAANVYQFDDVRLGEGSILSPFVTLTSNVQIGSHFHANLYSYVEHDCVIGDYVTFAPRVSCNGNIHILDHAYIGAGAVIKQGTSDKPLVIGRGAVVGMGAVVTKDVPAGAVVVGNPARVLRKV